MERDLKKKTGGCQKKRPIEREEERDRRGKKSKISLSSTKRIFDLKNGGALLGRLLEA